METIKNYLDNMFTNLPKSKELTNLKSNILANMEEKYNELKGDGKSEHEAIGIVISEFGNIDELIEELGINTTTSDAAPLVGTVEAEEYLVAKKRFAPLIGIGVVLCILGVSSFLLIDQLILDGYMPSLLSDGSDELTGMISLFLFVMVAVGLFVYAGMNLSKYESYQKGIELHPQAKLELEQRLANFQGTFMVAIITGVSLCIFSPIVLFLGTSVWGEESDYPMLPFFLLVAIAVFIFIYFGIIRSSFTELLESKKNKPITEEGNQTIGLFASIIFLSATVIFLIAGFCYQGWATAWIVYPIAGILMGIISTIVQYNEQRKNNV